VRVLAEDLGRALGSVAHLSALRRTATGGFTLEEAVALDALERMPASERDGCLLRPERLVAHLPVARLDAGEATRLAHGLSLARPDLADGLHASVGPSQRFLGVVEVEGGRLRARRLARSEAPAAAPATPER
jgi:tRNA pseudouridine55 synthase